ncbi:DUF4179 domain-containing protein [Romboutsia weinsteinii]|uniref:DUF4179 domain-containing protein n=1 Tax=Romboutsia weinsteinii TaxID=2020949 RepID=A0A371J518_9FIRM|nr:DUF4179 domain-containing protein [Romboutsia weinsteinii]RDY27849.1 DUF4179 domain-containing protein [Romboutsia weinsteinii]
MDKIKIKDNIKVPTNLNQYILKGIDEGEKVNNLKKKSNTFAKPLKVAAMVGIVSLATISTAYAVEKIIDYFELRSDSKYKYEKDDFLTYSEDINLSKKDNGIEFKVDTIAVDDGFFNMTYTITSDAKISDIDEEYSRAFAANPVIKIIKDGKFVNFNDYGRFDNTEAIFESDYVLKGILRKPISEANIEKGTKLTIDFDYIFGKKGDWSIDIKLDEKSTSSQSKKYIINKSKDIVKLEQYDSDIKNDKPKYKDVTVNYTIDNVVISSFGSLITTTEKSKDLVYNEPARIADMFVLRDDEGNYIDVINQVGNLPDTANKPVTNTYEFIRNNDNIKSLTLIPFVFENKMDDYSEKIDIKKLPTAIKLSKYGKVIIEDFSVTDDEIIYSYKKDGALPYEADIAFYDKDGDEIIIGSMVEDFVNRKDGTHTKRHMLTQKKYKDMAKNIKYIAIRKNNSLKLLEDQRIDFKLK